MIEWSEAMKQLTWKLVLPLTVIFFGTLTKWWYCWCSWYNDGVDFLCNCKWRMAYFYVVPAFLYLNYCWLCNLFPVLVFGNILNKEAIVQRLPDYLVHICVYLSRSIRFAYLKWIPRWRFCDCLVVGLET